jgi:phosphocarrier protein
MIKEKITLLDKIGFHARTASLFAKKASSFNAEVSVEFMGKKVNGKSTLSLMTLGVKTQNDIFVIASGVDEVAALKSLIELIKSNFND